MDAEMTAAELQGEDASSDDRDDEMDSYLEREVPIAK